MDSKKPLLDFMAEATRILDAAGNRQILLRLVGAVAFGAHCPKYGRLQRDFSRQLSDIDYASYGKYHAQVRDLFLNMGYTEHGMTNFYLAGQRFIFHDEVNGRHSDVFFDELSFNHVVNLRKRLELDYPTISLSDLMLEKMQIVHLNRKDLVDTLMLVIEHDIDSSDKQEHINGKHIAQICANDWGFWRTVTLNLDKLRDYAQKASTLADEDRTNALAKIEKIEAYIRNEPKSLNWKLRARVGENRKWYTDVEEISRE